MHVKASSPATPVQEPPYTAIETNKDLETSSPSVNKWIILALAASSSFMTTLDGSIINIGLPTIARTFHTGISGSTEWIIIGYLVIIAATLLTFGRLADILGRARRRYGTILVDLETHRLLGLLADCEADTVAAWFRQHPNVQIVTRDRSPTFSDAIRRGAPHALYIADRFHLHMNAMTCLETVLMREQITLRWVAATLRAER
ncbi:transposase [Ktedonobacter racemifer]|uniref:Transposase IS204/IS1001/IS1096/IS1165 family protein n=1 Tax=Ktedonobacter racemifer DSM 44963 TaxID=485913 RepID=D6U196_KTERA|nr:transposase [Ktedonobacter racemifer]EFH82586.1 transposase IS204/IS1001/IS1096/IS1165 family protein [Ktedonobacter racemifer DSM 44963]